MVEDDTPAFRSTIQDRAGLGFGVGYLGSFVGLAIGYVVLMWSINRGIVTNQEARKCGRIENLRQGLGLFGHGGLDHRFAVRWGNCVSSAVGISV